MREFGFRAWVDDFNYYAYDIQEREDMFKWFGHPTIHIEQYTGLKDKNGIYIYEGDIVKCILGNKPIVFHDCRYWLGETLDDLFVANLRYDIEVIGNIHEHKELLDGHRED